MVLRITLFGVDLHNFAAKPSTSNVIQLIRTHTHVRAVARGADALMKKIDQPRFTFKTLNLLFFLVMQPAISSAARDVDFFKKLPSGFRCLEVTLLFPL